MCKFEKHFLAAALVNSLKPHCVSFIPLTVKMYTSKWNPRIKIVRNNDRVAIASSSMWALDPQTMPLKFSISPEYFSENIAH